MLTLVDYFAGSFSIFVLAAIEAIGINWIYGKHFLSHKNFCTTKARIKNQNVALLALALMTQ